MVTPSREPGEVEYEPARWIARLVTAVVSLLVMVAGAVIAFPVLNLSGGKRGAQGGVIFIGIVACVAAAMGTAYLTRALRFGDRACRHYAVVAAVLVPTEFLAIFFVYAGSCNGCLGK